MNTKKFDLNEFMKNRVAKTKLGNPVKFITITNDNKLLVSVNHRNRVVGSYSKTVVPTFGGETEKYNLNGKKYAGVDSEFDLINI